MHYNATESEFYSGQAFEGIQEYETTRHWPMKIFLNLIDVVCVITYVL